jgi:integrase/recombinase XerD
MKLIKAVTEYVAHKRAMGMSFDRDAHDLMAFCKKVGRTLDVAKVTGTQINTFLAGSGPVTNFAHRKYSTLAGFNRFAVGRGYTVSLPLPKQLPKKPPTLVPYILTREELRRLLEAVPLHREGRLLEPLTMRAVLLLLYGAGLRISEAVSLAQGDVDLAAGILTIRDSKFYKTRLVPLGPQLHRLIRQYAGWRDRHGYRRDRAAPFFVLRSGAPVNHYGVRDSFVHLRDYAQVRHQDGQRPRLHDFRHTFAVHRLLAWYRQGDDVQALLPKLAVFLGHKSLVSTQVYLTMTPELLQEAGQRFERYALAEVHHG